MFTGIIEGIGKIDRVEETPFSRRLWIETPFSLLKEKKGDSMAVNGCCLTIISKSKNKMSADISPETLSCTNLGALQKGSRVNLERSLKWGDRLGGHCVQGHVDGLALLKKKEKKGKGNNSYWILSFQYPPKLRKYFIPKGSVAVEGVSLTVNSVSSTLFTVCIIPHTQSLTTLTDKKVGDRLNLEVDVLAKYAENFLI